MSKAMTPEFRVSYPKVFKPEVNKLNGKTEYSIVAIFPKNADLSALKKAAEEVMVEKWGADRKKWPPGIRSPFRKHEDRMKEGVLPSGMEEGGIYLNLKSQQRPGVIDQKKITIDPESTDFYGGCYARATVNAFAYDQKGNRGVSFGLLNIQKTKDGDPFGSRVKPEDDFEAVVDAGGGEAAGSADDLFS